MIDGVIEIRGLRCDGIRIDVWVRADVSRAAASDDLADAIDIALLASVTRATVNVLPGVPAGRMAAQAARALLTRFPDVTESRVRITVRRPVGVHADAETVEVVLCR
ncbi:MAG: dihydroneopterin aldolase [Chloroflexota bacterium]